MPLLDYSRGSIDGPLERRYSRLAVLAAVAGGLAAPMNCGFMVCLTPPTARATAVGSEWFWICDYLVFALLPGVLGVWAIVVIRRHPKELTGEYIACVGIFASVLLLIPVGIRLSNF